MPFTTENVTYSARWVVFSSIRYSDKVTPANMVMVYLPRLTR